MTSAKKHAPVVSFFKTMNKSCLAQAAYMPIPEAFYNQHREELLKEGVTLEGAAGKEWEVEVVSGAFRSGWKAFSSDNGLKENDMVVFRCCGDRRMSFEVFSFDGCEKQQPVEQPRKNKKRSKGLDELENIAREADHSSKKARPSNSSGGGGRKLKNGSGKQGARTTVDFEQVGSDDETHDETHDDDNACHAKKALESDFAAAAADGQKLVKQIIVGVDDDTEIQIVIKKLTPEGSTAATKSKAIKAPCTAKSKSPTASKAPVSKASADRTPDALAGTRAKAASKAPASKPSVPAAAAVSKSKRRITKRPATVKAKTNSKVTLNNVKKRSRSIKKATSAQAAVKVMDACAAQVVISDDESQPEQESQRKKSKPQAKPKSQEFVHAESLVKARAEALKTDKPSTVIVMKKSNLQPSFFLTVPMVFARTNLPDEIKEFEMVDAADKAWSVRWLGSPKCAFSGGWCYFAQDHKLQMGDACVLELVGPGRIKMHIFKVSDFVTDVAGTQQAVVPVQDEAAVDHEVEREGATPGQVGYEVQVTAAVAAVVEEDDECVVTVAAAAAAEAAEAAEEEDEHDDGDDEDYDPMEDSPTAEDSPVMSNAVENGEDIE